MTRLDADLTVARGGFELRATLDTDAPITALFGPSGAGKSTLLHAIAGLIRPSAGRLVLGERVLFDGARGIFVPPHRRRIGYVFQESRLFPHLRVRGNLQYGARPAGEAAPGASFDAVVEMLEIGPLLERRPQQLSGGERRRVALGRALLSHPSLLLLDEPLAAVERGLRAQILRYLLRVRDELRLPMIYVSHSLEVLLQLSEQFVVLAEGRVLGSGDYYELLGHEEVFALADRLGMINALDVQIERSDPQQGITSARLGVQALRLPPWPLAPGARIRVGLRPQDVILAVGEVTGLSVQNAVAGEVRSITTVAGRALVRVDVGQLLIAEITEKARADLALAPGSAVRCLFKANALEQLGPL